VYNTGDVNLREHDFDATLSFRFEAYQPSSRLRLKAATSPATLRASASSASTLIRQHRRMRALRSNKLHPIGPSISPRVW